MGLAASTLGFAGWALWSSAGTRQDMSTSDSIQVAIGKLVRRFKSIERAGPPTRGGRARFRGFARYPIAVQT